MTTKQPRSEFIEGLDQQTLDAINKRIDKLKPLVDEYHELIRRRRVIVGRNGTRMTDDILRALAECPGGLTTGELASLVDKTLHQTRSTLSDLVKAGKVERSRPGFFSLPTPPE